MSAFGAVIAGKDFLSYGTDVIDKKSLRKNSSWYCKGIFYVLKWHCKNGAVKMVTVEVGFGRFQA